MAIKRQVTWEKVDAINLCLKEGKGLIAFLDRAEMRPAGWGVVNSMNLAEGSLVVKLETPNENYHVTVPLAGTRVEAVTVTLTDWQPAQPVINAPPQANEVTPPATTDAADAAIAADAATRLPPAVTPRVTPGATPPAQVDVIVDKLA